MTPQTHRPPFQSIPLETGLQWRGGSGYRYEEKIDGVWSVLTLPLSHSPTFPLSTLAGELMPDRTFYVFDLLEHDGRDLTPLPLSSRVGCLDTLVPCGQTISVGHFHLKRPATGQGGEFLEAILARGGEGIVAKELSAPYGATWYKCKRQETIDCIILEKNQTGKSTIRLGALVPSCPADTDLGWCQSRAAFEYLQVGDIVEIAAYSRTKSGKLREPRFIRSRPDKTRFGLAVYRNLGPK